MPKRPAGLERRGNRWRTRKAVPPEVRGIVGKRELVVSHKTSDYKQALRAHRIKILEFENQLDAAYRQLEKQSTHETGPPLSDESIQSILYVWFQKLIKKKQASYRQIRDNEDQLNIDTALDSLKADAQALGMEQGPPHENEFRCNMGAIETDRLLVEHSIKLEKSSNEYQHLKELVIRGMIECYERCIVLISGSSYAYAPDPYFKAIDHISPLPETVKSHSPEIAYTLPQLLEMYLKENEIADRTKAQYDTHTKRFTEFIGTKKPINQITRDDFVRYRDLLREIPSNAAKHFPRKTYSEIVKSPRLKEFRPLSPRTINKNFETLSTLFKHAEEWGYIKRNYAKGLQLETNRGREGSDVKPFNAEQMAKIFSAPLYAGCIDDERNYAKEGNRIIKRARFWVPLIALYSGMRLNEICQLYVEDVRTEQGVDFMHLRTKREDGREAPDKKLKNRSAYRKVPIHPALKEVGFLNYVRDQQKKREIRLFPELEHSNGGYSDPFQKWFARFLKSVGIKPVGAEARQLCFHSFRHTFRDALREAEVFPEHYKRICGWSESESTASDYGQGANIKTLYNEISKVSYPKLDLHHLKSGA